MQKCVTKKQTIKKEHKTMENCGQALDWSDTE